MTQTDHIHGISWGGVGWEVTKFASSLHCRHKTAIFLACMKLDLSQGTWAAQTPFLALPTLLINREQQESQLLRKRFLPFFFLFSLPSWWDQAPRHPPYPGTTLPAKALEGHHLAKSNGTKALLSNLENLLILSYSGEPISSAPSSPSMTV